MVSTSESFQRSSVHKSLIQLHFLTGLFIDSKERVPFGNSLSKTRDQRFRRYSGSGDHTLLDALCSTVTVVGLKSNLVLTDDTVWEGVGSGSS